MKIWQRERIVCDNSTESAKLNNILLFFYRTKQIFGLPGDEVKQRVTAKNSEFGVRRNGFFLLSVQM